VRKGLGKQAKMAPSAILACCIEISSAVLHGRQEMFFDAADGDAEQYVPLPAVRAINFVNHTECHCRPVFSERPSRLAIRSISGTPVIMAD